MCNNILQYGHFYAWGKEHGRQTMSMRFAFKFQYFHICNTPHHHFLNYVIAKYAAKWRLIPTLEFNEPGCDTKEQERLMLSHKHIAVVGWEARWYDLFLKYKQEIIDLFAFKESVVKACQPLLASTKGSCRLGVHIRRGDYATWNEGGTEVIFPKGNPAEDLYVLSECNYLIGPPSTFSLTAAMYHDAPLYWIKDAALPLTEASFGHFDELFQHIL